METTYNYFFSKEEEGEDDDDFLSNLGDMSTDNSFIIHLRYIHSLQIRFAEQTQLPNFSSLESFLIPFDDLFTNASTILYTMLSNFNIPETVIDDLSSELISFATTMISDDTSTRQPQILPMIMTVLAQSSYQNDVQEFDTVLEESINDENNFRYVRADLSTIDEMLKKVDIGSSSNGVTENTCSICLEELLSPRLNMENNDDNNNIVSTPCSHVYHKSCIVRWLETSASCPLCRFDIL